MAMACYSNYDLPGSQNVGQPHLNFQTSQISTAVVTHQQQQAPPHKDYTKPLHVDCSVEYELPNQAKPPAGTKIEPLLMIHPCYFRKMESQRRSPFINNMPSSSTTPSSSRNYTNTNTAKAVVGTKCSQITRSTIPSARRSTKYNSQTVAPINQHRAPPAPQQLGQQIIGQQAHYPVICNAQQQNNSFNNTPNNSTQYNINQVRNVAAVMHLNHNNQNLNLCHSLNHNNQQQQAHQQNQIQQQPQPPSWDHMATVPTSDTSMNSLAGIPGPSIYSKPVGTRDAMLSGGCGLYSNNLDSCLTTSGRWETHRSPTIVKPREYPSEPGEAIVPSVAATSTISVSSQQLHHRDDKYILSGKYRQYIRQHRLHPYIMSGPVSSFPHQLTASGFSQMQQVSCYNV
jgi:hypothetical protein